MRKLLLLLLMAALAIPVMQGQSPESFKMLRGGKAPVPASIVKNENFGAKFMTNRGTTTWDFEDADQLNDWTFVDNDGDGFNWEYYNNTCLETGRMKCHSGDGVMSSKSYDNEAVGALTPDNWMISPVVELGGTLKFWAVGQDATYCNETFAVYVCVGDPSDLSNFVQVGADNMATSEYVEYKYDLGAYQGQMGCFAIRHYNTYDMFMLNIDDVTLSSESHDDGQTPPTVITNIPDGCEVYTYNRNSGCILNSYYGISSGETDGNFQVAFDTQNGEVYIQNPSWYHNILNSWVKGTYDRMTGIITIPTGQYLSWDDDYEYGIQLVWGISYVYEGVDQDYYLGTEFDERTTEIKFKIDGDAIYLLNTEGDINAEFPFWSNSQGMMTIYSDDLSWTSIEFANHDEFGAEQPFGRLIGSGPGPNDPHDEGAWLVIYDKNGEEVFYTFNEDDYWDYYYECDGKPNYSFLGEGIMVPIDIATFGNYQENGFNVKFYVLIDGKRYGPSEDLQTLIFGESAWFNDYLKSNPLLESDNCFTLKLGLLGGGTGSYLFQCAVENGVPVLKASSYYEVVTGLPYSYYIHAIGKDGETKSFSEGVVDLYCDEFGTGDVPFYFYGANGVDTQTYGAETDMLTAVIDDPFAQMTIRGSNRFFTVPAGYRYRITRVKEILYGYYDVNHDEFGMPSNYYLYVQQLERLNDPIENVTFTVDKPTILKSDYQTFRARVDFKEEFADQVSDVKLVFNLPYWSEFIENSVMVGSSPSDYFIQETEDYHGSYSIITVPVAGHSQPVRLCSTPHNEGYTSSEAFVIYKMNGETFRRSIGKVSFYVSDASIYVTPVTTDSRITVYGVAAGGKNVKVYDGDVLIAETACLANGSWRVECNLHQPVNPSVHPIHATISTMDGEEIHTETVEVEYRLSAPQPDKVTMCFLDTENVFDFVKGTTTPGDYSVPNSGIYNTYFTFVANLKGTTATVHNMKFKILDTQGKIVTRNADYMPSRNEWVCYVSYPDVNKLPITVGFSYDYVWEGVLCHYENDFSDNTNGVTPNVIPHVYLTDPSGFVYEGVPSNRLEGVTATCYYKDPETGEAVLWNAEQYEQHNPLITDENGYYRWDVPVGLWQVKYEKEGYETTYSDWLPVPPPQLDVNIGMVDKTPPTVVKAHAYPQAVELEFGKYMYPETLTADNISVSVNGKAVSGTIELLDAEVDDPLAITTIRRAPGTGLTFASRMRFNATSPFNASEVTLRVKKDVTSYAGVQMAGDYEAVLPLEQEMQAIVADGEVNVSFMGERLLSVSVQPAGAAAGKVLNVRSMAPMIATTDAESYTLDSNGAAVVTVRGDLPGASLLVYSVEGYDLTASTLVNVTMEAETTVATPAASIASGSEVEKGTAVYLFCSTPGATIYYTLDGSSPQDNTAARKTYDGSPIIIDSDVTIQAMAVAPGLMDSEVATFTYHVANTGMKGDVNLDGSVNIADINLLIDYILRDRVTSEMLQRGDVNGDKSINIADINEVIQIILGSSAGALMPVNTPDQLHINDLTLRPGETGTLRVTVDNASRYSALQCDIVLPDGLTIVDVTATGDSRLETASAAEGVSRMLTFSMDNRPLDIDAVLTLTVRADASLASNSQLKLTDIVMGDAQGKAWYPRDCAAMVNKASGINDLTATGKQVANVRYYNMAGQEMQEANGMTIVVTTYTDGSVTAVKVMK